MALGSMIKRSQLFMPHSQIECLMSHHLFNTRTSHLHSSDLGESFRSKWGQTWTEMPSPPWPTPSVSTALCFMLNPVSLWVLCPHPVSRPPPPPMLLLRNTRLWKHLDNTSCSVMKHCPGKGKRMGESLELARNADSWAPFQS